MPTRMQNQMISGEETDPLTRKARQKWWDCWPDDDSRSGTGFKGSFSLMLFLSWNLCQILVYYTTLHDYTILLNYYTTHVKTLLQFETSLSLRRYITCTSPVSLPWFSWFSWFSWSWKYISLLLLLNLKDLMLLLYILIWGGWLDSDPVSDPLEQL